MRGYIAMLVVDTRFRGAGIGAPLIFPMILVLPVRALFSAANKEGCLVPY